MIPLGFSREGFFCFCDNENGFALRFLLFSQQKKGIIYLLHTQQKKNLLEGRTMEESRFELFDGLIASAGKTLQRIKTNKMEKYGLGSPHTTCLCKLGKAGDTGVTQKELTEQEGIDRAQVSRVLRDLEQKELVEAVGSSAYKRRYCLTEKGRRITAEINSIILEINRYVSEEISDADIAVFYRVMQVIDANMKKAEDKFCRGE